MSRQGMGYWARCMGVAVVLLTMVACDNRALMRPNMPGLTRREDSFYQSMTIRMMRVRVTFDKPWLRQSIPAIHTTAGAGFFHDNLTQ